MYILIKFYKDVDGIITFCNTKDRTLRILFILII